MDKEELIWWVYANIMVKWDVNKTKGVQAIRCLSGYGQARLKLCGCNSRGIHGGAEQRDHVFDNLDQWDGVYIDWSPPLLGVRLSLALQQMQPSSKKHVEDIQAALPIHGAYVGIPLSARAEMSYIRRHIQAELDPSYEEKDTDGAPTIPAGVWQCLQSAVTLREPVLVFPVIDMITYEPLPGLAKHATGDPSLQRWNDHATSGWR
jgi:hypothetical protein